jgi:hypothetical protein
MRAGRPVRAMLRIKSDPWMLDGDGALEHHKVSTAGPAQQIMHR